MNGDNGAVDVGPKLQYLNHDVISEIFSHLDLPSFMRCRQLCMDFCVASIRTRGIQANQGEIINALEKGIAYAPVESIPGTRVGSRPPAYRGDPPERILRCISNVTNPTRWPLFTWAASNGFLDSMYLFKWVRDSCACSWFDARCRAAANGHLEALKWLWDPDLYGVGRTNGPETYLFTHETAAANGHLDIIEWLWCSECGKHYICRPDRAINAAAGNGHTHVIEWFYGLSCRERSWFRGARASAEQNNQHDTLRWIRGHPM